MIRILLLVLVALSLSSCSKPDSPAQCMLTMMENQPDSASQYAKTVCEKFFPPLKTVYDADKDKISWKQNSIGNVLMIVPRDSSEASYITYVEAQFSKEACGAIAPRWLTASFLIDYGQSLSDYETIYENGVSVKGGASLKCMRVTKLSGRAKPPSILGEITSKYLGENYLHW